MERWRSPTLTIDMPRDDAAIAARGGEAFAGRARLPGYRPRDTRLKQAFGYVDNIAPIARFRRNSS